MDIKSFRDIPPWDWPTGAGKMFLRVLRDDQADESDRLLAVELAGDFVVINDELVHGLLTILCNTDESETLRSAAAGSLGPALEEAYIAEFEDSEYLPIAESTFLKIQETLHDLYEHADTPKEVRRRLLEVSVRAPQDWHQDSVHTAYASDDEDWKLTAVFSMCFVRGFNDQILESLDSDNPNIHYQAVRAAGAWEVAEAWPHIAALIASEKCEKGLLFAAIEAAVTVGPEEAGMVLGDLLESEDEDIVEAAYEAIAMVNFLDEEDTLLDDEDDFAWGDEDDEDGKVFH